MYIAQATTAVVTSVRVNMFFAAQHTAFHMTMCVPSIIMDHNII